MPTYLRKFYYEKLVKTKKQEKEEIDKSKRTTKSISRLPKSRFNR